MVIQHSIYYIRIARDCMVPSRGRPSRPQSDAPRGRRAGAPDRVELRPRKAELEVVAHARLQEPKPAGKLPGHSAEHEP